MQRENDMDYPRFRAIEAQAHRDGTYRHYLVDIDKWRFEHEMQTGSLRGSPNFRNMDANTYADMYRAQGWTVVKAVRTHMGYLGPRFLSAIERLAAMPLHPWTMVPVESDWTVILAFSDADDAAAFTGLATGRAPKK